MVSIKQQLVPTRSLTSGVGNLCNYITIHETANTAKGANAQSHANLQSKGNSRLASWHYQVDDKEIIQSFLDNVQCWHAGDGQGKGNMESIGIEICVNSDGNFKNAVQNAAELVKQLMEKHNIPINNVVQHNRWSGKDCPHNLRDGSKGIHWGDFIGLVKGSTGIHIPPKPEVGSEIISKPKNKSIDQLADEVIAGKHGSGADRKKSLGSQYDAVQKLVNEKLLGTKSKPKPAEKSIDTLVKETLAGKHGNGEARKKSLGKNYQAVQDVINGNTSTPKKPSKPKGDQKTNSIVDYLKSIKADSSFANRKKLATKHGIKNYSGTPAQNTQLLKKLRG